jgi:hypothetical protein
MQRGDIKGPPYVMPDNIELTFLRKFIERQAARIPHNPRLRKALLDSPNRGTNGTTAAAAADDSQPARLRVLPPLSESPEPSDESVLDGATSSDEAWDTDRRHLSRGQSFCTASLFFFSSSIPRLLVPTLTHPNITERSIPRYSGPLSSVSYPAPIKSSPRLGSIRSLEEDAESSSTFMPYPFPPTPFTDGSPHKLRQIFTCKVPALHCGVLRKPPKRPFQPTPPHWRPNADCLMK